MNLGSIFTGSSLIMFLELKNNTAMRQKKFSYLERDLDPLALLLRGLFDRDRDPDLDL